MVVVVEEEKSEEEERQREELANFVQTLGQGSQLTEVTDRKRKCLSY